MHQHSFKWGLISFFLARCGQSHKKSTPHTPRPPSGRLGGAESNERALRERDYRPGPTTAPPAPRRADSERVAAPCEDELWTPIPLRRSAFSPEPLWRDLHPERCRSAHRSSPGLQASISLQENPAMRLPFGACASRRNELFQVRSLFWIQSDHIDLAHSWGPPEGNCILARAKSRMASCIIKARARAPRARRAFQG